MNAERVKNSGDNNETNTDALMHQIHDLQAKNEAYLQTISYLSNELVNSRKRHVCSGSTKHHVCKKDKKKQKIADCLCSTPPNASTSSSSSSSLALRIPMFMTSASPLPLFANSKKPSIDGFGVARKKLLYTSVTDDESEQALPLEVFLLVFRHLQREDLERCQLVCKRWRSLIKEQTEKLPKRVIRCLKLIEKSNLTLTVSSRITTKKYAYALTDLQERSDTIFDTLKRYLVNSYIKRIIICNLNITDDFCRRLANCFKSLKFPEILRVEMLAVNLHDVSPDVFHKFLGQTMVASQYFMDGIRNAMDDHFSSLLFEQPAIRRADDFTVYDVRSLDNEDVLLAVGDDVLLSFIFGSPDLPRRNTLYLDSPDISPSFLANCLLKFVECDDTDRVIYHVEFAHCHEQQVPTLRNIVLEYEHNIQVEWSAKNKKTGQVMEARVSRNGDDDDFCHLTLSIQSE